MMVKGGHSLPFYALVDSNQNSFKYRVDVRNITAVGSASTKQRAKQECAKSALVSLGYIKDNMVLDTNCFLVLNNAIEVNQGFTSNYVGQLNEFASKNGLPYPNYKEDGFDNGFVVKCQFCNIETTGICSTKKNAKQKAAEMMLKR